MLQLIPHEEHFIKEASENDILWEQLQCGNKVHTPWQQVILRHGRHLFSVTGDVCHKIKGLMSIIFFNFNFFIFSFIYILFVSLLSGCCAISGFERHLRLADHSPRFHVRALNPLAKWKSHGLTPPRSGSFNRTKWFTVEKELWAAPPIDIRRFHYELDFVAPGQKYPF